MLLYALVFAYLTVVLVGVFLSDKLIFQPQRSSYKDSSEILKLQTAGGDKISAMYLANPQAKFTILYSHSNAEDIGDLRPWLEQLRSAGFSVFAYDYAGYGTSEGTPSEKNVYSDAEAAYGYLTGTVHVAPENIISYGRSVGNGASIDLASRQPVGGLIVQSGFTSAFVVLTKVPLVPFDKFRNISKIRHVNCPALVIHGRVDPLVGLSGGEATAKAIPGAEFLVLDEMGHDVPLPLIPEIVGAIAKVAARA